MAKPLSGTYPSYFEKYINLVPESDLGMAFRNQRALIDQFFYNISTDKQDYAYAPGKWTLKEMVQHIIDAERVFNYRALAFARKDNTSLPSFDEDSYAANAQASRRDWKSLCDELKAVRNTTEMLYNSFQEETLGNSGIANKNPMTVLAMGFTTIGHLYHHKKITEERYLNPVSSSV